MKMMILFMMIPMTLMTFISPTMMIPAILSITATSMYIKWIQMNSPWISLIFSLVFLGGMMVIFMYVISSTSKKSEKNKMKTFILANLTLLGFWETSNFKTNSILKSTIFNSGLYYMSLCLMICLVLILSTSIITSPFKALKSAN